MKAKKEAKMSAYCTRGSFTFKAPDSEEYEIDYDAKLHFGDDERRGDVVKIEPSGGEEIPMFEEWYDEILEMATNEAYKQYNGEK
jgi:hypothetical protein